MINEPVIASNQFNFSKARERINPVVIRTPLQLNARLSKRYSCNVYLKREDLQVVRSYKIRGAYNLMSCLSPAQLNYGLVCASAGNHAQGFAFSCAKLQAKGVVFMPVITPKQKINQVRMFGGDYVEIILTGDTYDDCANTAMKFAEQKKMTFVPPFDHPAIIEGQGTIGVELLEELPSPDYLFIPVGGGGLAAGVGSYFKLYSPKTKIIGVEPEGAASMTAALNAGHPISLDHIDRFVDGASVKKVGQITFEACRQVIDEMVIVPEGRICTTILKLYNEDAIVAEPAGALSISALKDFKEQVKGKDVVCIISGSNNDIDRMQEIKERSLQYEGLKHYFLISFAQRPGALKEFVNNILGPTDDITRFEYMQKTNKENGPALVGIELQDKNHYRQLLENLEENRIEYKELNNDDSLYGYIV